MGDLFFEVKHGAKVSDYTRELDIKNSEGRVRYSVGDTQYLRTYFGSYPDKTMVYRFESTTDTDYSITYKSPHTKSKETFSNATYSFQGFVADNGMQFETSMKFETDGVLKYKDGEIFISGAKHITISHVAATDYKATYPIYNSNDYIAENKKVLQHIEVKSYEELRATHREDYHNLFDRVTFDLGENKKDSLATDKRLIEYAAGKADAGLEELYFQYSRYLMIVLENTGIYQVMEQIKLGGHLKMVVFMKKILLTGAILQGNLEGGMLLSLGI